MCNKCKPCDCLVDVIKEMANCPCAFTKAALNATCMIPLMIILLAVLGLEIGILITVTDNGDLAEYGLEWANGVMNIDAIADYYDLSHDPSKPSEFFERPELGECCKNMCKGSRCFAGSAFLARDDHCNNCCFMLTTPASCTDYSCTCFANAQNEGNRRGNEYLTTLISIDRYVLSPRALRKNKNSTDT